MKHAQAKLRRGGQVSLCCVEGMGVGLKGGLDGFLLCGLREGCGFGGWNEAQCKSERSLIGGRKASSLCAERKVSRLKKAGHSGEPLKSELGRGRLLGASYSECLQRYSVTLCDFTIAEPFMVVPTPRILTKESDVTGSCAVPRAPCQERYNEIVTVVAKRLKLIRRYEAGGFHWLDGWRLISELTQDISWAISRKIAHLMVFPYPLYSCPVLCLAGVGCTGNNRQNPLLAVWVRGPESKGKASYFFAVCMKRQRSQMFWIVYGISFHHLLDRSSRSLFFGCVLVGSHFQHEEPPRRQRNTVTFPHSRWLHTFQDLTSKISRTSRTTETTWSGSRGAVREHRRGTRGGELLHRRGGEPRGKRRRIEEGRRPMTPQFLSGMVCIH